MQIHRSVLISVIPSEVEESLDYAGWEGIERCLDYARHDKNSFFTVEIIGLLTLDDDAIGG